MEAAESPSGRGKKGKGKRKRQTDRGREKERNLVGKGSKGKRRSEEMGFDSHSLSPCLCLFFLPFLSLSLLSGRIFSSPVSYAARALRVVSFPSVLRKRGGKLARVDRSIIRRSCCYDYAFFSLFLLLAPLPHGTPGFVAGSARDNAAGTSIHRKTGSGRNKRLP